MPSIMFGDFPAPILITNGVTIEASKFPTVRTTSMDPRLREEISRLEVMLSGQGPIPPRDSQSWENAVALAKVIINGLDSGSRARRSLGVPRWVNFVGLLQKLAYVEPDDGGQPDLAAWCERQWTEVLENHPHNVPALQGLGHAWLLKCQPIIAQIYRDSEPSHQGTYNGPRSRAVRSLIRGGNFSAEEITQRINSPNYTEARSLLRPSLESFDRATEHADLQGAITGPLLELAAEAYMSFGNVSHPRNNEICYQKSLNFLQRASQIEGYIMDPYLNAYLQGNMPYTPQA